MYKKLMIGFLLVSGCIVAQDSMSSVDKLIKKSQRLSSIEEEYRESNSELTPWQQYCRDLELIEERDRCIDEKIELIPEVQEYLAEKSKVSLLHFVEKANHKRKKISLVCAIFFHTVKGLL